MTRCFLAADLHGSAERYAKLFRAVEDERPDAVFLGGDLLPHPMLAASTGGGGTDFVNDVLAAGFERLRGALGARYPRVFVILGNDDGRFPELAMLDVATRGVWSYLHGRCETLGDREIFGYSYVPPTPFRLKDWERYDVSRYVDPGCVSPEDGARSVPVPDREARHATIREDLERLVGDRDPSRAVFLFHSPPYRTNLDRAALDGKTVDHAPLDVHVGSIAMRRFIEKRQPWLCMHGHVHESARLRGDFRDSIGRTVLLGGAHDGPELALVSFDLERPGEASRRLL